MPAKRRRTLFRNPSLRARMWEAKTNPEVYSANFTKVKELAINKVMQYQTTHENLISMVKSIVAKFGCEGAKVHEYVWFAQKLWKLTQTYSLKALQKEADALYLFYRLKGDEDVILRGIAQSLGIKISSIEDILKNIAVEVGVPSMLEIIARGTVVTDGSEQVILEYVGNISMIQGWIDLSNLEFGIGESDTVIIREYVKINPDGDYVLHASSTYSGAQEDPALYIMPRLSGYALKITIQQVSGTLKSFDYLFTKG